MQLSLRWAERSKRAFETAPAGYMLFGIAQGGDVPELRQRQRAGPRRHRLSRLRDRWPRGRRTAIGHARHDRGGRADPARGAPALFDGRWHTRRYSGGGRARRRHVRLRDADPQRPSRHGVHAVRTDQSAQRPPRRRSAAARRGKFMAVHAQLCARLPASPRQIGRDAGSDAAVGNQRRLLPAPDARTSGRRSHKEPSQAFANERVPNGQRATSRRASVHDPQLEMLGYITQNGKSERLSYRPTA